MQPTEDRNIWLSLDRTIHEPARLAILSLLAVVEAADFTFIMRNVGLTGGNLGAHITKLELRGFVQVQKEFVERQPRTLVRLTEAGRTALAEYREVIQRALEAVPLQPANERAE